MVHGHVLSHALEAMLSPLPSAVTGAGVLVFPCTSESLGTNESKSKSTSTSTKTGADANHPNDSHHHKKDVQNNNNNRDGKKHVLEMFVLPGSSHPDVCCDQPCLVKLSHTPDAFFRALTNIQASLRRLGTSSGAAFSEVAMYMVNDIVYENVGNSELYAYSKHVDSTRVAHCARSKSVIVMELSQKQAEPVCAFPSTADLHDRRDVSRVTFKLRRADARVNLVFEEYFNEVGERVNLVYFRLSSSCPDMKAGSCTTLQDLIDDACSTMLL